MAHLGVLSILLVIGPALVAAAKVRTDARLKGFGLSSRKELRALGKGGLKDKVTTLEKEVAQLKVDVAKSRKEDAESLKKLERQLKSSAELFPQPMPLRSAGEQKLKQEIEEIEVALKKNHKEILSSGHVAQLLRNELEALTTTAVSCWKGTSLLQGEPRHLSEEQIAAMVNDLEGPSSSSAVQMDVALPDDDHALIVEGLVRKVEELEIARSELQDRQLDEAQAFRQAQSKLLDELQTTSQKLSAARMKEALEQEAAQKRERTLAEQKKYSSALLSQQEEKLQSIKQQVDAYTARIKELTKLLKTKKCLEARKVRTPDKVGLAAAAAAPTAASTTRQELDEDRPENATQPAVALPQDCKCHEVCASEARRVPSSAACDDESCNAECTGFACGFQCEAEACASNCSGELCGYQCYSRGCASNCTGSFCGKACQGYRCAYGCVGRGCAMGCIGEECGYGCQGEECAANCTGKRCSDESRLSQASLPSQSCACDCSGQISVEGVAYVLGPSLSNEVNALCDAATSSLDDSARECSSSQCESLFDYNCDGLAWRSCQDSATILRNTPGSGGCSRIRQAGWLLHGAKQGGALFTRQRRSEGTASLVRMDIDHISVRAVDVTTRKTFGLTSSATDDETFKKGRCLKLNAGIVELPDGAMMTYSEKDVFTMSQTKKGLEVLQNDVLLGTWPMALPGRQLIAKLFLLDKFASLEVLEACRNLGESNTSGSALLSQRGCIVSVEQQGLRKTGVVSGNVIVGEAAGWQ